MKTKQNHDRLLTAFVLISVALIAVLIYENNQSMMDATTQQITNKQDRPEEKTERNQDPQKGAIKTELIIERLKQKGIVPQEAKYWETLE